MHPPALDQLESLVRGLTRMHDELSDRLTEIGQQTLDGLSDSGLVRVTARADGTITDVHVDHRALRLTTTELAEQFRQAATRAQENAATTSREHVRSMLASFEARGHTGYLSDR